MISPPQRSVTVAPERLARWLAGFAERHGEPTAEAGPDALTLTAPDGAQARLDVPFPPWTPGADPVADLLAHVARPRRVGALLVRKGGFAVGEFDGGRLAASKVDSSYVQGRTKAGGWSQQRFARRRENQAAKAYGDAADVAVRLLLPAADRLDAVVTGGDAGGLDAVLADPRLAPLRPLVQPRRHAVPDPRLRVLEAFPAQFLAVTIGLVDPG